MKFDKEKCKKKPFDVPVSGFQQLKKTDLEQKKKYFYPDPQQCWSFTHCVLHGTKVQQKITCTPQQTLRPKGLVRFQFSWFKYS